MDDKALAQYLLQGGTMPQQTLNQIYGFTGYSAPSSAPARSSGLGLLSTPAVNAVNQMAAPASAPFNPNGFGDDPLRFQAGSTEVTMAPTEGLPSVQVSHMGQTPKAGVTKTKADLIAASIFGGMNFADGALGKRGATGVGVPKKYDTSIDPWAWPGNNSGSTLRSGGAPAPRGIPGLVTGPLPGASVAAPAPVSINTIPGASYLNAQGVNTSGMVAPEVANAFRDSILGSHHGTFN